MNSVIVAIASSANDWLSYKRISVVTVFHGQCLLFVWDSGVCLRIYYMANFSFNCYATNYYLIANTDCTTIIIIAHSPFTSRHLTLSAMDQRMLEIM